MADHSIAVVVPRPVIVQGYYKSTPQPAAECLARVLRSVRHVHLGGWGRIAGTVKNKGTPNTPVYRRVRLYRDRDAIFIDEKWSDPITGAYAFENIDERYTYTVIAFDHTENFRAEIADRITPERMP